MDDGPAAPVGRRRSPAASRCAAMQARAVDAVRDWNARIEAEHGADAVYLMCSHGDIIKSLVADALGMHLDLFQRISVEPVLGDRHPLHPRCGPSCCASVTPGTSARSAPRRRTPPGDAERRAAVGGGAGAP